MAVSPPSLMLKIIWLIHFILASWALMSNYIEVPTYWFTHAGVLAFGFWAMASPESVDAVVMFLATMAFSVVNDIILLALYEPRGHDRFEDLDGVSTSRKNEYRFALGMTITNLIIKPVSLFLLYRVYQSRNDGSAFNTGFPAFGGGTSHGGAYDNIESKSAESGGGGGGGGYYQQPPPPVGSDAR